MKAKYLSVSCAAIILAAGIGARPATRAGPSSPPGDVEPFEQNFSFFLEAVDFWVFTPKTSTAKTWAAIT